MNDFVEIVNIYLLVICFVILFIKLLPIVLILIEEVYFRLTFNALKYKNNKMLKYAQRYIVQKEDALKYLEITTTIYRYKKDRINKMFKTIYDRYDKYWEDKQSD